MPTLALEQVPWRTGDVVLTTHAGADTLAFFTKRMPNHAALVWVHPEHGACLVETAFSSSATGQEPTCVVSDACTFDGTRVTPLADYVRAYPYLGIHRRPFLGPDIADADMAAAVAAAMPVPFEPLLGSESNAGFVLGLALRAMAAPLGPLGKWIVDTTRSPPAQRRGVFCSELVVHILQALALVRADDDAALPPAGLTSLTGFLDRAAAAPHGAWGPEHVVVAHSTHQP
jgi:hypothetical protein